MNGLLLALALLDGERSLPPLSDVDRFPRRERVVEARCFACAHLSWLQCQYHPLRPGEWERREEWLRAAQWCYACWDRLDDVQIIHDPLVRGQRLAALRELIGVQAYAAGVLPAPVPSAYFARR